MRFATEMLDGEDVLELNAKRHESGDMADSSSSRQPSTPSGVEVLWNMYRMIRREVLKVKEKDRETSFKNSGYEDKPWRLVHDARIISGAVI